MKFPFAIMSMLMLIESNVKLTFIYRNIDLGFGQGFNFFSVSILIARESRPCYRKV